LNFDRSYVVVDEEFDDGRGETVVRTGDPYAITCLLIAAYS